MNEQDLKQNARQYLRVKHEASVLVSRQTELKNRIMSALDEVDADDRGHREYTVNDDTFGSIRLTKQRRVSKVLNMDVAEDLLAKKGIKEQCVKMVPVLDEAAIMSAFYEGYLTEQDIDTMFPAKESFAFLIDVENPEA